MADKVLQKPSAFLDVFGRKPGIDQTNTHYCPGCGHGIAHKLIAEAVSDLGLIDRVIMAAPVGCAVFLYYYFKFASLSVAHGRAPAALTGVARAHPDAVVISYQGDGDLAAIGTAEIIHAANRGERMAVFFVNNAIYGMTKGQMAPTTPVGMVTATTPYGRSAENEGNPIAMSEIIAGLQAPVYVERVSLDGPKAIMRARAAVRKAIAAQDQRKGFCFVEMLSPCPTQWKLKPTQTGEWIRKNMVPIFPLKVFKDQLDETEPRTIERHEATPEQLYELMGAEECSDGDATPRQLPSDPIRYKFAGFGGQGILKLGQVIVQAATDANYQVTWLPSYGPEARGGTANTTVILSTQRIGSPQTSQPDVLVAMNRPSLEKFWPTVAPGGLALYNSSIADPPLPRDGVRAVGIPANDLAEQIGNLRAANIVMLGAYQAIAGFFEEKDLDRAFNEVFASPALVGLNRQALATGRDYVLNHSA